MIEIDGEKHEGGGQTVRLAVALSVVLKKSCRIKNIRAKRSRPGLGNQHVAGVNLVEELAGCEFIDNDGLPVEIGATSIIINADEINYTHNIKKFTADAKTAGSCALMAQVALPVCPKKLDFLITANRYCVSGKAKSKSSSKAALMQIWLPLSTIKLKFLHFTCESLA